MNSKKMKWKIAEDDGLLPHRTNKEFPVSLEIIPRQKSFACLSLKFGCVISACILIPYTVVSLAQCTAALEQLFPDVRTNDQWSMISFGLLLIVTIIHAVTLFLTTIMLVGALREKTSLLRPWVIWTSIQVFVYFLLFVFWTVMYMVHVMKDNALIVYFVEFMSLLVRFYMLMLVASFYRVLEEEQSERLMNIVNNDVWYNTA